MTRLTALIATLTLSAGAFAVEPAFDTSVQHGGHFGYDSIAASPAGDLRARSAPAFDVATQHGGHFGHESIDAQPGTDYVARDVPPAFDRSTQYGGHFDAVSDRDVTEPAGMQLGEAQSSGEAAGML
jgi:hypothetical protein